MIKLDFFSLTKYLNEHGFQAKFQKETDQIYLVMEIFGLEVPIFISLRGEGLLLQTVAYLPFTIKEENFSEVARFLHHFNRDLDMPGFGMDEREKLIYYRAVIPSLNKEIDEEIFNMYLKVTRIACETCMKMMSGQNG